MPQLGMVKDYMYLQQMRFGERITYDIKSEVNQENVFVPAFTFQPLVENAIVHGLSRMEEGGSVRIRIRLVERKLHIYIGDNGKGMEETELKDLRLMLNGQRQQEGEHMGIGLGNIYRRIYAMYEEGSVEIYSKYKAGPVIKLEIPQRIL